MQDGLLEEYSSLSFLPASFHPGDYVSLQVSVQQMEHIPHLEAWLPSDSAFSDTVLVISCILYGGSSLPFHQASSGTSHVFSDVYSGYLPVRKLTHKDHKCMDVHLYVYVDESRAVNCTEMQHCTHHIHKVCALYEATCELPVSLQHYIFCGNQSIHSVSHLCEYGHVYDD
jgi:hypothetical protein